MTNKPDAPTRAVLTKHWGPVLNGKGEWVCGCKAKVLAPPEQADNLGRKEAVLFWWENHMLDIIRRTLAHNEAVQIASIYRKIRTEQDIGLEPSWSELDDLTEAYLRAVGEKQ